MKKGSPKAEKPFEAVYLEEYQLAKAGLELAMLVVKKQ